MKIVLDAMGGDYAPVETVAGAVDYARQTGATIFLVGRQAVLEAELAKYDTNSLSLPVVDAPDVIAMDEKPAMAVRRKKKNSMVVGMRLVKEGQADAFCSVGHTGAVLTAGHLVFRRMRGVHRAVLVSPFPNASGFHIFGDIGANADCKPEWLVQWAHMMAIYATARLGVDSPRVAILSNGEEEGKGNQLVREAQAILATESELNYIGVVEPKEMIAGEADVVITDGFTGNVVIKLSEAIAKYLLHVIKGEIMARPVAKIGGLLAKPAFKAAAARLDDREYGVGLLLGLNGMVTVGHGRSRRESVVAALSATALLIETNVLEKVHTKIESTLQSAR